VLNHKLPVLIYPGKTRSIDKAKITKKILPEKIKEVSRFFVTLLQSQINYTAMDIGTIITIVGIAVIALAFYQYYNASKKRRRKYKGRK
jgi:ABC-type multidrug transport system permease subunit